MQQTLFPDTFGRAPHDTLEQSRGARDEALERVASSRPGTMARAQLEIIALLSDGASWITADDIYERAPDIYEHGPQAVGSAFMNLARRGVIERVGMGPSRRKRQHAANLMRWGRGPHWGGHGLRGMDECGDRGAHPE